MAQKIERRQHNIDKTIGKPHAAHAGMKTTKYNTQGTQPTIHTHSNTAMAHRLVTQHIGSKQLAKYTTTAQVMLHNTWLCHTQQTRRVNQEIFVVKKFLSSPRTTKIKHTKYFQHTYYLIEC